MVLHVKKFLKDTGRAAFEGDMGPGYCYLSPHNTLLCRH